jgi:hypothetical protein
VAAVYASPWIVVLAVVMLPTVWYLRKRNSQRSVTGRSLP